MKIKELISHLSKFDENLSIKVNSIYQEPCPCGETCYCSVSDHILDIYKPMLVKDMSVYPDQAKKTCVVINLMN